MHDANYWLGRAVSRRSLIRGAGLSGLGLAGAALVGCSGDDDGGGSSNAASPTPAGPVGVARSTGTAMAGDDIPRGGNLKVAFYKEAEALSPRLTDSNTDMGYLECIGDTYIHLASNGKPGDTRQALFQTVERPDDTTLVASLQQGVKFHNGSAFNAKSVKDSLEFLMNPDKAPDFGFASSLQTIASIETVDDQTVRLNLSQADSTLGFTLGTNAGLAFSVAEIEARGDDELGAPIMTGPFVVDYWRDGGASWAYKKNPEYWGTVGFPYLDSMEFVSLTSAEARAAALESGQADIIGFEEGTATSARLQQDDRWQFQGISYGPANFYINHYLEPLNDVRVRRALDYASNRQKVLETIYVNQGSPATSFMPVETLGWFDYQPHPFNPAEATKLMAAAGFSSDNRARITAEITGLPPKQEDVNQMSLLKEMYDAVGFEVEITNVQDATGYRRENRAHARIGSTPPRHPALTYEIYFSTFGASNAGRDSTEAPQMRVDELVLAAKAAPSDEALEPILEELNKIVKDEVISAVPLVTRTKPVFGSQRVGNFSTTEFICPGVGGIFRPRINYIEET